MSVDPETRLRLLELVYELLSEDEAAGLRAKIDADPELAEAYAQAQADAVLLGEAARLESPRIALRRPEKPVAVPFAGPPQQQGPKPPVVRTAVAPRANRARWANWAVGVSAAVLLVISMGGYFYHRGQLSSIVAEHLRLQVAGPPRLQAGAASSFSIVATSIDGEPVSAQIEFALYAPDGRPLAEHKERTDDDGRLKIALAADGKVFAYPQVRLEVRGVHAGEQPAQTVEARLAVEPDRHVTHLALDKPLYRPGETVRYRSLTLSRFGLAPDRAVPVRFEILDPRGSVVEGSQRQGVTDRGVGCGEFVIPPQMPGGQYTLVARSPDGSFPDERRKFFVRAYRLPRLKKELEFGRDSYGPGDTVTADFSAQRAEGGPAANARLRIIATVDGREVHQAQAQASPAGTHAIEFKLPEKIERGDGQLAVVVDDGGTSETIAKTVPINLGKFDVRFYPEGGGLVAGIENRVYFSARDSLGKPVHLAGRVVDGQGRPAALVETTHEGMGAFQIEPLAGEQYRLKLDTPQDAKDEPRLPPAVAEHGVVLTTGQGVFEPGKPLEFNVRARQPGLPLVAAAWCRGVPVGQQAFVTQTQAGAGSTEANPVILPLDESVGGVIRLTIYDYRAAPPKPIAERLVYRRPARRLHVEVGRGQPKHAPGETVEVPLRVTDESGKPAQAALGVAVADDALLNLADDRAGSMTAHFVLGTEVEKPEDLEKIDFYLSDDPKAAKALDLLLGTQGWRRFVEKTLEELRKENRKDDQIARLAALGGPAEPPTVLDNLAELKTRYQQSLDAYRTQRTRVFNALITLTFLGGVGLLLFVAMLSLMSVPCGVRLWAPAIGVAAVCLLVGTVLLNPQRRAAPVEAVAFASFENPLPQATAYKAKGQGMLARDLKAAEFAQKKAGNEVALADVVAEAQAQLGQAADALGVDEALKRDLDRAAPAAAAPAPLGFGRLAAGEEPPRAEAASEEELAERPMQPRAAGRRRNAAFGGLAAQREAGPARFVVRQYAHQHRPGPPGVRTDFAETLYWHPLLVTDAQGGAAIRFDLSDSVTAFRVLADAHADNGRIGSGAGQVVSRIPFSLEPKLPPEVTAGDRIDLPLAVANDTDRKLPVVLRLDHGPLVRLEGQRERKLDLPAGQRGREFFTLDVVGEKGDGELVFRGTADRLADAVKRPLAIVPPGFPKSLSFAGQLEGKQEVVVRLPDQWVRGSLKVGLAVFPSTLSNLKQGLEGMLQEPNGCFEQASSSNYPNVMALQYMQEHDIADPAATRRARELLKAGYAKLTGYESPTKGYEWFGGDPGHEALTAYGLMEFRDMARVYDVDRAMLQRTADWLLARRDGKGGFQRNPRALDSFGAAPAEITDAYITWALADSGQKGIDAELNRAIAVADKSNDPYLVALAAGAALAADRRTEGRRLAEKLAKAQAPDGHLEGALGSITRSGGLSLRVETTALGVLAWLKLPECAAQASRAIDWIAKSRQGSGFGSTQATVLALKALTAHSKANRRAVADGKLVLRRGETLLGQQAFSAGRQEAISLGGLETKLQAGENRLSIELTGDNKMPYTLNVSYRSPKPANDEACPVRLSTKLAAGKVRSGETVALDCELANATDGGQPMTVAIIGLPAGLEVRPDQLEDLKKSGTIDAYETRAREVIFYWRSLAPKKQVSWKLDLVAAVPGRYTGPASRAYLYYTAEQKQWADPLAVEIARE